MAELPTTGKGTNGLKTISTKIVAEEKRTCDLSGFCKPRGQVGGVASERRRGALDLFPHLWPRKILSQARTVWDIQDGRPRWPPLSTAKMAACWVLAD